MNAQGYPCVGTATTDGCVIFGFQSVRVNVQNTTPQITESGTGTVIPQNLSATAVGSVTDPAFHGPYLVAVAKYHRNTCYKPDLSGERQQSYSVAIPTIEPTCSAGQVVRTAYQEISVSKSAAVTAAVLNGTTASEVHFDFSSDPIPVNATDLFIQVVYRGPMGDATLGQEADAIAVGTLDVREPTFASFWNNTDSWWNESIWGDHNTKTDVDVRQTTKLTLSLPSQSRHNWTRPGTSGHPLSTAGCSGTRQNTSRHTRHLSRRSWNPADSCAFALRG